MKNEYSEKFQLFYIFIRYMHIGICIHRKLVLYLPQYGRTYVYIIHLSIAKFCKYSTSARNIVHTKFQFILLIKTILMFL